MKSCARGTIAKWNGLFSMSYPIRKTFCQASHTVFKNSGAHLLDDCCITPVIWSQSAANKRQCQSRQCCDSVNFFIRSKRIKNTQSSSPLAYEKNKSQIEGFRNRYIFEDEHENRATIKHRRGLTAASLGILSAQAELNARRQS
jgi:hypothetical protein